MVTSPQFDLNSAHHYFAAYCFNQAWELMEKRDRTPAEDEEMLRLNMASIWHWTRRDDCTATNLSVGYWQTARICTMLNRLEEARHYGLLSLAAAQENGVPPFFRAYAFEALARVEAAAGNRAESEKYVAEARRLAEQVQDEEDRQMLTADLATI